MATSPITAKIFAGEALDETEKKSLTQEQEWLHVLLQEASQTFAHGRSSRAMPFGVAS